MQPFIQFHSEWFCMETKLQQKWNGDAQKNKRTKNAAEATDWNIHREKQQQQRQLQQRMPNIFLGLTDET